MKSGARKVKTKVAAARFNRMVFVCGTCWGLCQLHVNVGSQRRRLLEKIQEFTRDGVPRARIHINPFGIETTWCVIRDRK